MEKYICLDLGTITVGIATSDTLGIAYPKEQFLFEKGNYKKARNHINELSIMLNIDNIVIGLPLQIDRQIGERAKSSIRFGDDLKREHPNLKIIYHDESYSTIEAHERLMNCGYKENEIKKVIDMYSAVVILEDFLRNKGE